MPLVIPPAHAQLVGSVNLVNDPEPMIMTIGVKLESVLTQVELDTQSANFKIMLEEFLSANYRWNGLTAYVGQDGGPPVTMYSSNGVGNFAGAYDSFPPNSAFLVHKRTDLAGRRNRGRMYIPGIGQNQVDDQGNVLAAQITSANTVLAQWMGTLFSGGVFDGPVILHATGISPTPPPTPITSITLDPRIASQRRRLRR